MARTPGVLVANMHTRILALTEHLLPGDERSGGEIKFSPSRYVYSYETALNASVHDVYVRTVDLASGKLL